MSAKIIEFEGIDGSGKTTALKYTIASLRAKGLRVLETREVGSPHIPVCAKLRDIVLSRESDLDGRAMEFIFAAMRIENQKFYESVKDDYDYIVSDRGWLSHLAYTDNNVDPMFTDMFYCGVVEVETDLPDHVVFLTIDPRTALARRSTRNGFVDAIEAKGPQFQEQVYESFTDRIDAYSDSIYFHLINANGDMTSVQEQLDQTLSNIVQLNKLGVK